MMRSLLCFALLAGGAAADKFEFNWKLSGDATSVFSNVTEGDEFVQLALPGFETSPWLKCNKGEVMLPVHRVSLALRAGVKKASVVEIRDAVYEEVDLPPGVTAPLPSRGDVYRCGDDKEEFVLEGNGVSSVGNDGFSRHGADVASLTDTEQLRDVNFQVLTLAPIEYAPSVRRVRVLKSATVVLDGVAMPNDNSLPIKAVKLFAEIYAATFANAGALQVQEAGEGTAMILHASSLANEAARLATHKESVQGVKTVIKDIADVPKAGETVTADEVKTMIASAYTGDIEDLATVIILGSADDVPAPIGTYSNAICDSCLGFVTADYSPDVIVSRLVSTKQADSVGVQIDKIVHYETTEHKEAFMHRAYGVASRQSGTAKRFTDCMRSLQWSQTLLDWNYTSRRNECDPFATTDPGLNELEEAFNSGRDGSLFTYLGHGGGTFWVMTGFNVEDAHALTNSFNNPVVLDGSCNCGDFGHTTIHGMDECLAEAMMVGNPDFPGSGAVSMWSSAPTALWVPPADMTTGSLAALTNGQVTKLGALVFAGVTYMRTQWPDQDGLYTIEGYNLFGDSMMGLDAIPL